MNPNGLIFQTIILLLIAPIEVTDLSGKQAAAAETDRPNIIILMIDDLGYGDIGCFGNKRIPTPHVDALARQGSRCTMSYITNPPCSPSRCSLMTGMYAQRFGKSGMARGLPIPADHPTMAEFITIYKARVNCLQSRPT